MHMNWAPTLSHAAAALAPERGPQDEPVVGGFAPV